MKRALWVAVIASSSLLTGCSELKKSLSGGANQASYTPEMKETFVAGCTREAMKNVGEETARKYCACTFDRVSSTIPVDEWVKLDSGETVRDETRTAFKVAIAQCGGNAARV